MTDLAELRALEPPIVIANRLHSRAAVYTEEGRHNAWGQLMLDGEATILSLIAEVERLRGERGRKERRDQHVRQRRSRCACRHPVSLHA